MALDDRKSDFTFVGTRPNRPDGLDKVTGRAKFGADAYAPGMLHAAVVRSPHAHAKIVVEAKKAPPFRRLPSRVESKTRFSRRSIENIHCRRNSFMTQVMLFRRQRL